MDILLIEEEWIVKMPLNLTVPHPCVLFLILSIPSAHLRDRIYFLRSKHGPHPPTSYLYNPIVNHHFI